MPSTGSTVGACQCSRSTRSRRSTSTAVLTPRNTTSSSRTMVEASTASVPVRARNRDTAVVTRMATHGVRRPGSTFPRNPGNRPSRAMP